jgi:hypothetical protein
MRREIIDYKEYCLDKICHVDWIYYGQILVKLNVLSVLSGNEEAQVINCLKETGIREVY